MRIVLNEKYKALWNKKTRYYVVTGGRGSGQPEFRRRQAGDGRALHAPTFDDEEIRHLAF